MSLADDILCTMPLPAPLSPARRVRLTDSKPKPQKKRAAPGTAPDYEANRAYRLANNARIGKVKQNWVERNRQRVRVYKRVWTQNKRGGRSANYHRGESNKGAKLTAAKVIDMRLRRAAGARVEALAVEFGISAAATSKITRGLSWAHVPMPEVVA